MLIMVLVFVLGTFGMNFQITTALMATKVFHKGAGEYGLLGSIMAIGSLSAALLVGPPATAPPAGPARRPGRLHGLAAALPPLAPTYVRVRRPARPRRPQPR